MSLTSSFVIIFILLARLTLKKASKIFSYALWSAALFRLICPFSFESVWSLLPVNSEPIGKYIAYAPAPQIETGLAVVDNAINPVLPAATLYASVNPLQIWIRVGEFIWIAGIMLTAHQVTTSEGEKLNVWDWNVAIFEKSPFIAGETGTESESEPDTVNAPDSVEYKTEAEFLNSPDGTKFQRTAYRAAKAYLSGDLNEFSEYLSASCVVNEKPDLFKDVDYMILKRGLYSMKSESETLASYEFLLNGEDSVSYVSMEI